MTQQFPRKVGLIVYGTPASPGGTGLPTPAATAQANSTVTGADGSTQIVIPNSKPGQVSGSTPGLDLSNLRIQFHTTAMDIDAPPTAVIRVINLADSTAQQIQKEFQGVLLQAGYQGAGAYGVIFQGSIIRVTKGRINNIDTFVDIMASNLEVVYNFGFVNKTVAKGAAPLARANAIASGVNASPAAQAGSSGFAQGMQYGNIPNSFNTGGTLPRGKVMFGLARDYLQPLAKSQGCSWSIGPDGKVNFIPLDSYLPGQAVLLTAQTGLIGVPAATQQGIEVECLLNPNIKLGTKIQLDNASINTTINKQALGFPAYSDFQFFANTSNDGVYRSLVVEHEGDSRGFGDDWKTKITCLALDQSAAADTGQVAAFG